MRHLEERYYHRFTAGGVVQGDIWTGLPGAPMFASQIAGIVITPRCDLAHSKTRVLNYLPIVALDDYLEMSGGYDLLEVEETNAENAIRNAAVQLDVAELYDIGTEPAFIREVVQRRIDSAPSEKHREKIESMYSQFVKQILRRDAIRSALEGFSVPLSEIERLVPRMAMHKYKRDLVRNARSDVYFFPPCAELLPLPSAALLRNVMACSSELLQAALASLGDADWSRVQSKRSSEFSSAPARPERVARLKTPYVEALLSRFCALFGRIGTRDLSEDEINQLIGRKDASCGS